MLTKAGADICKGCFKCEKYYSDDETGYDCSEIKYVIVGEQKCPCLNCIAKTSCSDICEKLDDFASIDMTEYIKK